MSIYFYDMLRSRLASGKLIFSNAIRAATGKRIVTDVADTNASVTLHLEDEHGTAAEVVISKTGGPGGATSFGDLQGMIADNQIPASIMRDAEFTAAAVRNLLSLTSTEVNDLLTGATISGQTLTFTQNDGSTIAITIPTAMAGTGDGVVQSGTITGNNLVLTLDNGGQVSIDLGSLSTDTERNALQGSIQAQIDHITDELHHGAGTVTNVASAVSQNVANFAIPSTIYGAPGDYQVKLTIEWAALALAPLSFHLPQDLILTLVGTGNLSTELPSRAYNAGRAKEGTYHILLSDVDIENETTQGIRVTATVGGSGTNIELRSQSHATFTLIAATQTGVDQTARNNAAVAQARADLAFTNAATAQGEIDTHEAATNPHMLKVGDVVIYTGGQSTYDATNNRLTTSVDVATLVRGDAVLFQLPAMLGTSTDAITLRVNESGGDHETYALVNFDLSPVNVAELVPNAVMLANWYLLADGTTNYWVLLEPTDLTQGQVEANSGADGTHFGLISGERVNQGVIARVENFARIGTTAHVPYTRLPDVAVFKAAARRPGSGSPDAFDDRISGEHVLFWDTQLNYIYVHDGGGNDDWIPLTFGSAQFLAGPGVPSADLGTSGSIYMQITRDGEGNVSNWYVWTKGSDNIWAQRYEIPIQSNEDIDARVLTVVPEGTIGPIEVEHTAGLVNVSAIFNTGYWPVLANSNGTLRDPTFAEWVRQCPGYANGVWYHPKRRFVGVTDGTLATIDAGDSVTRNSVTYRFRDFHHHDDQVTSPQFRDVYMTVVGSAWTYNAWRTYTAGNAWTTTLAPFGHHTNGGRNVWRGIALDDNAALHDATTVGDIYAIGSGQHFTLKSVSALPTAGTAQYYWEADANQGGASEISETNIKEDDGTVAGLISGRRFEAAFANKFTEVANEAAALAASSSGDTTIYWWETSP